MAGRNFFTCWYMFLLLQPFFSSSSSSLECFHGKMHSPFLVSTQFYSGNFFLFYFFQRNIKQKFCMKTQCSMLCWARCGDWIWIFAVLFHVQMFFVLKETKRENLLLKIKFVCVCVWPNMCLNLKLPKPMKYSIFSEPFRYKNKKKQWRYSKPNKVNIIPSSFCHRSVHVQFIRKIILFDFIINLNCRHQ